MRVMMPLARRSGNQYLHRTSADYHRQGDWSKSPLHLYTSEYIIWPRKPYSLSRWAVP
jgi:hypothetical protein